MIDRATKGKMHPRNRFRDGYDFTRLIERHRPLARFVAPNAYGNASTDFANPDAVKALNQALLVDAYGIRQWDIPRGYLCPPIPGRSDYIHYAADLLADPKDKTIPRGSGVAVLDVGMGANCIYPIIGASEYGWRFVGSEIDRVAVDWATKIVASNPSIANLIECRLQLSKRECFRNVIQPGEFFNLTMCNPPFHASAAEAAAGNIRKQRNLGGPKARVESTSLNFGGQSVELWCPGGELGFIQRMIGESVNYKAQCRWFTTLVSKSAHVPRLHEVLEGVHPAEVRTLEMGQGQKQSRVLAWRFMA